MTVLVWILTYAIHSTVLIASVWVLTKLFRGMSLATQESLWKAAILGGLATATLQLATGASPPWGHLQLPAQLDTQPVAVTTTSAPAPASDAVVQRRIIKHDSGDLTITTIRDTKPAPATATITATSPMDPSPWPWVLLGLVGLGSVFALLRLGLSARRMSAKLKPRRQVVEDPVLEAFLSLCEKAELKDGKRVKLTASPHLRSPVALRGREIVLPERAIERLSPAQQQGMVAHELAHVIRRDPYWSVLTAVVEALFFFQPLNHLARRKIQEAAEFQCDDWAARHTGTGVHLAKCLAEVAAWLEDGPATSPIAVSMADDSSPIVRRITRLLHGRRGRTQENGSHAWFALRVGTTLGLLGLVAWLVPGVSREPHAASPPSDHGGQSREAFAASMQMASDRGMGDIVVRELGGEGGTKRSQVRIEGQDEVVRVEVERVPEPPRAEPPDDEGSDISIIIHGGVVEPFGFPFGDALGWLDLQIEIDDDDFDVDLDGFFGECHHGCRDHDSIHAMVRRQRRDAERQRERMVRKAERMRERAQRQAERAREHTERARERVREARRRLRELESEDDDEFSI